MARMLLSKSKDNVVVSKGGSKNTRSLSGLIVTVAQVGIARVLRWRASDVTETCHGDTLINAGSC